MLTALTGFLTTLLAALPWILRLLVGLLTTLLLAALIGVILLLLFTHLNILHAFPRPTIKRANNPVVPRILWLKC